MNGFTRSPVPSHSREIEDLHSAGILTEEAKFSAWIHPKSNFAQFHIKGTNLRQFVSFLEPSLSANFGRMDQSIDSSKLAYGPCSLFALA
jgi:hypothetical protein